jgi:putative ABC transport system permease protein
MNDLKFALRQLLKNPGFTAVAVLTLALGIGANTVIFSALQAVLFRQPPYAQPDALVRITETQTQSATGRGTSPANLLQMERTSTAFSGMSAYFGARDNGSAIGEAESFLTGAGNPVRLKCLGVLPGLFDVLGVAPMLGRNFTTNEIYDSSVVMLSYGCWQTQFAADPNIIGRAITLGGNSKTVIGVMPRGFFFPSKEFQVFWTPGMAPGTFEPDKQSWLSVIARLRPGVSIEQARSQLSGVADQLTALYPEANKNLGLRVTGFHSFIAASSRPALLLLLLAVEVLFLIVCSNLANLLLSRASSRGREFSIRSALGAGRGRIVRQLLTESLALSVLGGLCGFALAATSLVALRRLVPGVIPSFAELGIGTEAILFNGAMTLLAPLLFGIVPAVTASRPGSLGVRGESAPRSAGLIRNALISAEVALSVVLLASAGLLIHSFLRLENADLGFRTKHTVTFRLVSSGPEGGLGGGAPMLADIENRLRALPGVQAVGGTWSLPLRQLQDPTLTATVEGRDGDCSVLRGAVTLDYFKALRTPLLQGRFFNDSDTATSLRVALVNEAFQKAYLQGEDPVGKRFKLGRAADANAPWLTIVGVVGDQKRNGIDKPVAPAVWGPVSQITPPTLSFVLRGSGSPGALVACARSVLQAAYKDLNLLDVATLDELVQGSIGDQRFRSSLLSAFASVALLLSAIGVYGVLAFSVVQRSAEIGIRMALGAQRGDVLRLVLRQGLKPAIIGLVFGLAGALASSRVMRGLLYGIGPNDPVTFVSVMALLLIVATLACWLPARRASKVDPMNALRSE